MIMCVRTQSAMESVTRESQAMSTPVRIRPMRPSDEPQAEALWKGMSPYRPGDEAEVEAMYETVRTSRDAGDKRWKALGTSAPDDPIQDARCGKLGSRLNAFGRAENPQRVVGSTVQVRNGFGAMQPIAPSLPPTGAALPHDSPAEWRLNRPTLCGFS